MKEILKDARINKYAVGGFDCWGLESIKAVIEAAEETHSPAIILTGGSGLGSSNKDIEYFGSMGRVAALHTSVPIAIHLNEAKHFSLVVQAIRSGFTSVMLDIPNISFKEYIDINKKIVEIAHSVGVSVEAQLGHMPLPEEISSIENVGHYFTDPDQAKHFVDSTDIDALAISFGNIHLGKNENNIVLNFDILERITELTDVPLVVHGGSGFPKKYIKKTIELGCNKFNIGLIFRNSFLKGIQKSISQPANLDSMSSYLYVEKVLNAAKNEMKIEVINWMKLLGSVGKG
jgi:ketose-bisphosphate aldolase